MKNIMKKFLSIFVVLTLALCALACNKDKAKENANVTDADSTSFSSHTLTKIDREITAQSRRQHPTAVP